MLIIRVLSYIEFDNDALVRVLDECDVADYVFYRILTSEMMLWLEFWTNAMFSSTCFIVCWLRTWCSGSSFGSEVVLSLVFWRGRRAHDTHFIVYGL